MRKKHIILLLTLAVTLAGLSAFAQIRDTDIVLNIRPEHPNPNQDVSASLGSHVINLDKANIVWSVNGEDLSQGIGKKSFSFKTGGGGSPTVLFVMIDTVEGESISKSITLNPAEVDMLWEASDAYTPPFYKGKALPPSQGKFKITAVPNIISRGEKVSANNLSYSWILDGNPKPSSSGWGKSSFIFQNSYLDGGNSVKVKISDISGNTSASAKIDLRTANPKIIFYENDPSFGVKWENALHDRFTINPNGTTITAEPYFFSPKNISAPELTFNWSISGQKIETPNPRNELSIKPEVGQPGNAIIKVMVENVNTLFQTMSKQISVQF